jgi:DegV family protein with EDD domain
MRVVLDDAGDVPVEAIKKYNLTVVPVNVMFGTEEFLSGISITHETFYEKVKAVGDHNFPKTSQPNPWQFKEAYENILADGEDEILTITVSEKLSKTYDSAESAAKELNGKGKFYLFDSQGGSAAMGFMAIEAARMAEAGQGIDAIMARLEAMRESMVVTFLINSLEYAVKGGRVSALRSTMASLLNIKPIMKLEDGLIVEASKVRTYKKAMISMVDFVVERVGSKPVKVAYLHARDHDGMKILKDMARPRLNISEEIEVDLAIAVAINLGPGALGIVAIPEG